jgi:hypothetical protein
MVDMQLPLSLGDPMKAFCLVILTFFALYNPKVSAKDQETTLNTVENVETELDKIVLVRDYPMKNIDENLQSFTELIKIFKTAQAHNIALAEALLSKVQDHKTLSGDDLYLIKRTFALFYKLNSKMLEFGTLYQFKGTNMAQSFSSIKDHTLAVKSHLIWLSANVMTMDNMEAAHKIIYDEDSGFRRIFKSSFSKKTLTDSEKATLEELTEQVQSLTNTIESRKFGQQVILVRSISAQIKTDLANIPNALILLDEINTNKIANDLARGRTDFKIAVYGLRDAVVSLFNKITNFLSAFFGNAAGSIRWRTGYLNDNAPAIELAKSTLRPMDILLEKSPFALTDKFIPGHYGHVAIYLGTKTQLESIGMWDHPSIIPYHDDIEAGNTILEAIRPGVHLNSIEGFMNIDEYTIVRKTDGLDSSDRVYEEITRGIDQLGKEYDFNFDISTLDKIVCSELVYIVFGHVTWPTAYRLGRPTITPDDIGDILFQKNTRFKMTDYVISTKRQTLEHQDINFLANIFEYEVRNQDGDVPTDPKDPTNSFWKKETKCYNVGSTSESSANAKKTCKTTYKEFIYEEAGPIIND